MTEQKEVRPVGGWIGVDGVRLPLIGTVVMAGAGGIDRYPHARIEPGKRLVVIEVYDDSIRAMPLGDDEAATAQRAALAEWAGCIEWDVDAIPEGSGGLAPWFWSEVSDTGEGAKMPKIEG